MVSSSGSSGLSISVPSGCSVMASSSPSSPRPKTSLERAQLLPSSPAVVLVILLIILCLYALLRM